MEFFANASAWPTKVPRSTVIVDVVVVVVIVVVIIAVTVFHSLSEWLVSNIIILVVIVWHHCHSRYPKRILGS